MSLASDPLKQEEKLGTTRPSSPVQVTSPKRFSVGISSRTGTSPGPSTQFPVLRLTVLDPFLNRIRLHPLPVSLDHRPRSFGYGLLGHPFSPGPHPFSVLNP